MCGDLMNFQHATELKWTPLHCWLSMKLNVETMKTLLVGFLLLFSSVLLLGQNQRSAVQRATNAAIKQGSERLAADTPKTTLLGNAFVAPKGWSIRIKGPATILTAPEGASWVALVDVQAKGRMKR